MGEFFLQLWGHIKELKSVEIIDTDEQGVRWRSGHPEWLKKAGWYLYVPFFWRVETFNVMYQELDCQTQSILTADGQSVTFSINVGYVIPNAFKMRTRVQDFDSTLERAARGHAAEVVNGSDLGALKEDLGLISEEVKKALQAQTKGWGVKIESVKLTDFVPAKQYRMFGGSIIS